MSEGTLSYIIPSVILLMLLLSLVFYVLNVVFLCLKNPNPDKTSRIADNTSTFNIVPIILAIFLCIDAFFFCPVRVSGISMNNTLADGDILIINRSYSKIKVGDIVVIEKDNGELIIKRVVAKEGDSLTVDSQKRIYVNNELIESSSAWRGTSALRYSDKVLDKGEYYVLGDNRNSSSDSRVYGIFNEEQIVGKVVIGLIPWKTDMTPEIIYN